MLNFFREDNGNLSMIRLCLFLAVTVLLAIIAIVCLRKMDLVPIPWSWITFLGLLITGKVVSKPMEESVKTPTPPPEGKDA